MRIATLKIIFFVFLICSFFGVSYSQVYPVQVSTQLLPPYSSYLPDYGDPANEKLKCILVLQDFSVTHRDVKLEIKITGNGFTIQTSPQYLPPPITLTPGVPVLITASDLAPYLATQNLVFTGLNAADYELRKILPEGYYSICIKAVDYYNSNYTVVSNESCNSAWFFLNDPPYLNFPSCEEEITPVTPQNIIFQWTAMNLNSPNSVLGTEYDFELFEIRPNNGIPNNVVQNSAPVFSITTTQPFFQYSITEPALYLGMKYVWRVRARDLSGRDLFKNDGWSQICTFTYGNINSAFPEDAFTLTLNATASTHRQGKVWWNHIANFTQYHVQVRKTGTPNWFDYYTADPELKINELEPSVSYEARVMGTGNNLESDWSNTASFTTPAQPEYGCNDQTQPINALASNPLMVAYAGMIFQIGQFEMHATQITPDPGAPGFYSGYGVIKMYMVNINVAYNHVFINDNLQITSGSVNAITDGMESWENEWLIEQENAYFPDSNVDSIIFNNDTSGIHVYTDNGDSLYYEFPGMGHPIVINEPSGVQYIVWPDGNIDTASWLILSDDYLDADTETKILFSASEDQQYGFDPYEHPEWFEEYETIKLIDDSHYFVSNKSLKISGSDFVLADYKGEELIFTTGGGEILTAVLENNKYKISLQNFSEDGVVYAMQGTRRLGKLNVKVYEELEKEVVLVRVGEVAMPEISLILQELNKTYQSGIVKWNVSVSQGYTAANWDENANGKVDIDDYSLLNKYSDEMDKIRNAFSDENVSDDAYVLFVIDGFGDVSVDGYMPYGRRYGFIKAGSAAKTYAHELGHGSFGLQHTFPAVAQGTTINLMDYGGGKNIAGWQWDWMREGHWLENLGGGREQILYAATDEASPWLQMNGSLGDLRNYGLPFMNGSFMKIKNVAKVNFNRYGQVFDFILDNGKKYNRLSTSSNRLLGYVSEEDFDALANQVITVELEEKINSKLIGENFFSGVSNNDSIVTYARRSEGHTYIDCYCVYTWKTTIESQINSKGYWDTTSLISESHTKRYCNGGDACDIDIAAEGVNDGVGLKLYIKLYKGFDPGSQKRIKLAELANYFSEKIGHKRFAFYGSGFEEDLFGNTLQDKTIELLVANNLLNIEDFLDFFPYSSDFSSDFNIIFSTKQLREDIPIGYNSNSYDWYKSSEGNEYKYEYSFADLVAREKVRYIPKLWIVVTNRENAGDAKPVSEQDFYRQYVGKYKTNSAIFFISEWSARWAKDPLVAYTFYRAAFMAPAGIGANLSYTLLKQAAIGGMVDYLMQIGLIYYFSDEDISFTEAMSQVDYYEVGVAAFTSMFSDRSKITTLVNAGAECVYNGFTAEGELRGGFSYSDCARGVITAILVQKLSHGVINTIKNFPIERVYRGLEKIGTFSKQQIKDILEWIGFGADDIARVISNLDEAWREGWDVARVLAYSKGLRPDPVSYLSAEYISNHINKFKNEGAGFIVIKSWTEGGNPLYTKLPSRKFVGLRSEMDEVITKYKASGNDWKVLRDELNLGSSTNLSGEEIYYVKIDGNDSRFNFDIPNGNEGGAIAGEWIPGGYTKNGVAEAALVGSENIIHNKDINQLLNNFTGNWEKIK